VANFVCHQPPQSNCSQREVLFNGVKIPVTICRMKVEDTCSHQFDDAGLFISFPTTCLSSSPPPRFFRKHETTDPVTAKRPGVVVMIYWDTEHSKPYLELLVITGPHDDSSAEEDPLTTAIKSMIA